MFKFLRSRRGQIRGIDFSLAMIIFLLVMSQILVLTNTFIESSRSSQETDQEQNASNSFTSAILGGTGFEQSGTSVNWHNVDTTALTTSGWTFGLSDTKSEINPYKLGRLANNSDPNYLLNYDVVKDASNSTQDFKIRVDTTVHASIDNYNLVGTTLQVNGTISYNNLLLDNAKTWIFVIGDNPGTTDIAQTFVLTNDMGIYDVTFAGLFASPYYVVVVLTQFGTSGQTMTYKIIDNGTTPAKGDITLLDLADKTNGYAIQASTSLTNPEYVAVYVSEGSNNYTIVSGGASDIQVPQKGFTAIVAISGTGIAVTSFPLLLNSVISSQFGPADVPNTQSSVSRVSRLVRGVLLEFSISYWS
jgi:hypothetical protein